MKNRTSAWFDWRYLRLQIVFLLAGNESEQAASNERAIAESKPVPGKQLEGTKKELVDRVDRVNVQASCLGVWMDQTSRRRGSEGAKAWGSRLRCCGEDINVTWPGFKHKHLVTRSKSLRKKVLTKSVPETLDHVLTMHRAVKVGQCCRGKNGSFSASSAIVDINLVGLQCRFAV